MTTDLLPQSGPRSATAFPVKDRAIVCLIVFFTTVAMTLELYWLLHHQEMESRTDLFARIISIYWPLDHSWRIPGYSIEKALNLSLEGVNALVTPILSAILLWAIVKHRRYRYPLQLFIGTYTFYGTFLYFSVAHISGYVIFAQKSVGNFLLFYLANMPWLAGYGWMAWDAFRAIVRGQRT
jgi:EXPERA (EXPanded EBP superfamily)